MSGTPRPGDAARVRFIAGAVLAALLLLVLLGTVAGYSLVPFLHPGKKQPIPFSHRVHAGMKTLGCPLCHQSVFTEARAGLPELETCMLCHSRLIVTFPPIRDLREHYFDNKPVFWQRVDWAGEQRFFPDFVYFNHSMHTNRSIDCGHCHGPVNQMDRIVRIQDLNMGFCINCHKHYNATHDCFTCHR